MTGGYHAVIRQYATHSPQHAAPLIELMAKNGNHPSKLFYINMSKEEHPSTIGHLFSSVDRDTASSTRGICVIENISPALINEIGHTWNIDPGFFAEHAFNPPVTDLWTMHAWNLNASPGMGLHLDGIYEYHGMDLNLDYMQRDDVNYCKRHIFKDDKWPVNSGARMSYCRPLQTLYLFLVDAPIDYERALLKPYSSKQGPTLRFPYARNYGGILIPPPPGDFLCVQSSLLTSMFKYPWQIEYIFESPSVFGNGPFLYLMSHSLWESTIRDLDRRIKQISFKSIRKPNLQISDDLHEMREDLTLLRMRVEETIWYTRPDVGDYYQRLAQGSASVASRRTPDQRLRDILERAGKLHEFFIETFQLLANTITIRQAEESLKQTKQGVFLTRLAAVYLPLSVTTGVFGMNLREINDAPPQAWSFVVTLLGLVALTVVAYVGGSYNGVASLRWGRLNRVSGIKMNAEHRSAKKANNTSTDTV